MSIALMTKAWKTALPASRKLVLLALSDNANEEGMCWPSIHTIASKCSLTERAVYECLHDLEAGGYLKRNNRSGRSTIYLLNLPEPGSPLNQIQETPEPGSPPPLNHVQETPEPGSPIIAKYPEIEPSLNQKSGKEAIPDQDFPDWLPVASWEALIEHRKATKSPMTSHSKKLAINKLDELRGQGNDPVRVINQTILNGWKGLFPLSENQRHQRQPQQGQRKNIHDERAATISSLSGRNRRPEAPGRIIDITPTDADRVD